MSAISIFLLAILYAIALPNPNSCNAAAVPDPALYPQPAAPPSGPAVPAIHHPRSPLSKRIIENLPHGWQFEFEQWDIILPIQHAAANLEELYDRILTIAQTSASNNLAPATYFGEVYGQYTFQAFSTSSAVVPWPFLGLCTNALLDMVEAGGPARFRLRLWNQAAGVTIFVILAVGTVGPAIG